MTIESGFPATVAAKNCACVSPFAVLTERRFSNLNKRVGLNPRFRLFLSVPFCRRLSGGFDGSKRSQSLDMGAKEKEANQHLG